MITIKKLATLGIWIGISAVCLLLSFVFFLEFKANVALKKELVQKKEELKDAQKASRKLAELEKQADELKVREEKVQRQVALREYQPFPLIRTVTRTATKAGLRSLQFEVLPPAPAAGGTGGSVTEVPFTMTCEATFPQLLEFLKELAGLERIVTVRGVNILRQPQRIPYQSVVVTLTTYTFSE